MSFTAKIQRSIKAPVSKVWAALTQAEMVKQYFFGTNLVTTWKPGTPIAFRGEWDGKAYEDKGTVLHYEHEKMLKYDYFSSWSNQEDLPENYVTISYQVKAKGTGTVLVITQRNIESLEKKVHSVQNWAGLIKEMQKLVE